MTDVDFIDGILESRSVSVVGLAKHAGKTECLNYILGRVKGTGRRFAVTSIGVDGESYDQSSTLCKPEIEIYEGMMFVTSEAHYRDKRLVAEILDISGRQTALGRLVTARAMTSGKVLLSGPAGTEALAGLMGKLYAQGADTVLVDGALSRLSPSSPLVAEAMVLATGAAVSTDPAKLVSATRYICDLIDLPLADDSLRETLIPLENGVYAMGEDLRVRNLGVNSAFSPGAARVVTEENCIYVAGAVSATLLNSLSKGLNAERRKLIIKDFTRILVSAMTFESFVRKGWTVEVLSKNRLLAVCVNPLAPDGTMMDSDMLRGMLSEALGMPVYDVRKMDVRCK